MSVVGRVRGCVISRFCVVVCGYMVCLSEYIAVYAHSSRCIAHNVHLSSLVSFSYTTLLCSLCCLLHQF